MTNVHYCIPSTVKYLKSINAMHAMFSTAISQRKKNPFWYYCCSVQSLPFFASHKVIYKRILTLNDTRLQFHFIRKCDSVQFSNRENNIEDGMIKVLYSHNHYFIHIFEWSSFDSRECQLSTFSLWILWWNMNSEVSYVQISRKIWQKKTVLLL